ncbi:hypothetical protein [Salipiger sp. PrR007]|uniref:hypothetical protein n=1 Tax=Salipiger sp. PrR007 TaxID=2706884 RepID=UPI0013BAA54F|nr:hypothetical protein [Salipiger sp. PrR007]NDW33030.1 hypothetical protein [Salipiger sp. PrR007]
MLLPPHSRFEQPMEGRELSTGIRLGRGWHPEDPADAGAAWTRSPRATLQISAGHFTEPVPLRLQLRAFCASPEQPGTLRLLSPGQPVLQRVLSSTAPVTLLLATPRHAPGAESTALTLAFDLFGSPLLEGAGPDERQLGLALLDVTPRWPLRRRLNAVLSRLRRG